MHSFLNSRPGNQGNSQVVLIIVLAVAAVFALILGNTVGVGEYKSAYLMAFLCVGLFLIFKLQASFWIFIPFAMVSDLPAIPVGGVSLDLGQLWILMSVVCVLIYWPMQGKTLKLHVGRMWPVYLYVLIAFLTYMRNPVGLSSLGSGAGGMRYYMIIGLAFIAMVIIANHDIDNTLARKICMLLVFGVSVEFAWKLAQFSLPQLSSFTGRSAGANEGGGFYGSSQLFALVPIVVLPIIFGRFRLSQLLTPQRMWLLVVVCLCYVALLLSGKRSLAVIALGFPAMAGFFRGQLATSAITAALASISLATVLFLHSTGVELPLTAQRVLSVIPGEWDWNDDAGASADNSFRDTLNRIARDKIAASPWKGSGFKTDFELIYQLKMNPGEVLLPGEHVGGAIYSTTSNWHNTWLGITADFGIIATATWVCVWFLLLKKLFRLKKIVFRDHRGDYWLTTLILAILMWTVLDIVRSWQFGHSALNLWTVCWRFGILIAMENFVAKAQTARKANPEPAPVPQGYQPVMAQRSL